VTSLHDFRAGSEFGLNIGLVYKKGKFSAIEEQQLKDAIETYRIVSDTQPQN
jgi:hypothetical protein